MHSARLRSYLPRPRTSDQNAKGDGQDQPPPKNGRICAHSSVIAPVSGCAIACLLTLNPVDDPGQFDYALGRNADRARYIGAAVWQRDIPSNPASPK